MRKSILNVAKPLNNQMLKIHELANLLTQKNNKGIVDFEKWLFTTEEILKKNNQPQVSRLAVIRAQLVNYLPENKNNKRKDIYFNASNLLAQAQESLWSTNAIHNQKIETAIELINQLLVVVYQTKAFKFNKGGNFTLFLESIWNFCTSNEQLKNITIQIMSQISKADVLQIMAEEVCLDEFTS